MAEDKEDITAKPREFLALYTRGIVSFARAAELAGLSRQEMIRQARALGIQPSSTAQMFEAELEQVL
jgi:predicted HTH domain antitoxin